MHVRFSYAAVTFLSVTCICVNMQAGSQTVALEPPWRCHIIDEAPRGADGVKLADVNHDGLLDITTGWEEGGVTRVYLDPGPARAKGKWPSSIEYE